MVISQGEIWWANFPASGSEGVRKPVVVVQSDALNRSRLPTVLCVPLTSNMKWGIAPGTTQLPARLTGLDRDAVANVTRVVALDRESLTERAGKLPQAKLDLLLAGINTVLGK